MILDAKKDNHVELVIDGLKNEVITEAEVTSEFKKAILDDGVYMFCKYFKFNEENAQVVADNIGKQEDVYTSVIDWIDDAAQSNCLSPIDETLLKAICKNTVIEGISGNRVFYSMPEEWAKIIITELVKKMICRALWLMLCRLEWVRMVVKRCSNSLRNRTFLSTAQCTRRSNRSSRLGEMSSKWHKHVWLM